MTALPFALSLSSSFTEVGAIAAFAALLGIAILSLLAFSQAREIKRLREWAGRAPERAAELEQRVSADAAARVKRSPAPAAPAHVAARRAPLVSAPVSTAVNATVAAVGIGAPPGPSSPDAASSSPAPITPAPPTPDPSDSAGPAEPAAEPRSDVEEGTPAGTPEASEPALPVEAVAESNDAELEPAALAPATAAARAGGVSGRAPLPPSPAAPMPPGVGVPPRSPSRSGGRSRSVAADIGARVASTRPPGPSTGASGPKSSGGPKYFKPERSPVRATALIVGGVIVGAVLLVFAVSALKGSGGSPATQTQSSPLAETQPASSHAHTHTTSAAKPAETAVVVLNGTSTAGLAHHLAADLQQGGYARAAALAGVPPGTHATTVVQYTRGHRADAQAVAKALNVTQVQPIEGSTASLVGSAIVVVLAGADQASQLGGGGTQSKGEPAAASGEEGTAGSGH